MLQRKLFSQNYCILKRFSGFRYSLLQLSTDPCSDGSKGKPPSNVGPPSPTIYEMRKFGHNLPCDSVQTCFEPLPGIPTGIFRCTDGEVLGRGAYKCSYYQNPEYFSFHHMTFYDLHLLLRPCRQPCPKTGRKK